MTKILKRVTFNSHNMPITRLILYKFAKYFPCLNQVPELVFHLETIRREPLLEHSVKLSTLIELYIVLDLMSKNLIINLLCNYCKLFGSFNRFAWKILKRKRRLVLLT
jgi:hypothetical protein